MGNEELENHLNYEKEQKIKDLKNKRAEIYNRDEKFPEKLYDFVNELRKKYLNPGNYQLYHLLTGSSPFEDFPPQKYDFPGKDSIEKFIEENWFKLQKTNSINNLEIK